MTCKGCGNADESKFSILKNGNRRCMFCGREYNPAGNAVEIVIYGKAERDRLLNNARVFIRHGEYHDAEETFRKLLKEYPDDAESNVTYCQFRFSRIMAEDKIETSYQPHEIKEFVTLLERAKEYGAYYEKFAEFVIAKYQALEEFRRRDTYSLTLISEKDTDAYGLCKIWKLKYELSAMLLSRKYSDSNLQNAKQSHSVAMAEEQKHDEEVRNKKNGRLLIFLASLFLPVIGMWLALEKTMYGGVPFFIVSILISIAILSHLIKTHGKQELRYSDHHSSNYCLNNVTTIQKQIEEQDAKIQAVWQQLAPLEPEVFRKIRSR